MASQRLLQRVARASPHELSDHVVRRVLAFRGRRMLIREGVTSGEAITILGRPVVTRAPGSTLHLGSRVVLCSSSAHTALGVSRPVILRTLSPQAKLIVGDDCGLSGTAIVAVTNIQVGARVLMGSEVLIMDTDFHPVNPIDRRYAPTPPGEPEDAVHIGDDVFLGARSVVTKGVSIGSGTVIGAGSIVTSSIPAMVIAAGVPCRVVREL